MSPYTTKSNRRRSLFRRPMAWVTVIVVAGGLAAFGLIMFHKPKAMAKNAAGHIVTAFASPKAPSTYAAAEAGLLPWYLPSPLSRMAVYPGPTGNQVVLAGGLDSSSNSVKSIVTLNLTNGSVTPSGSLAAPVHDAGGAMIGNRYGLFGGGESASVSTAETFSLQGSPSVSNMPQVRSDDTAVTVGSTTYIIGGYNGSTADASVLTTADGTHFKAIGTLPIPVRYAAAAVIGKYIYVFGGEAIGGPNDGNPVSAVQIVDTSNDHIQLASWKLPVPIEGAAAFTVNGETFVAGGQGSTPESITTGVGTTQVPGVTVASSSKTYDTIWAVNASSGTFLKAGRLQLPVSNAGVTVVGSRAWLIGGEYNGQVVAAVQVVMPNAKFGTAGTSGAGSPYYGAKLMIADRGNNRILVMDPSMNITWRYPSATTNTKVAKGFYFPDDAFFANHGSTIISNQEDNETIVEIGYPSGKIQWTFGHPLQAGSAYGYLRAPDDAYLLKNNEVVVADDQNCRVLFINTAGRVVGQIGTTGVCKHVPNVSLGSPNGDTPLYDGNVLISEIFGSWVSEYTPQGKMVWTTHLPISYPSDPQQIGSGPGNNPDHYLIADYADPGSIVQFTREGKILSEYHVTSGPGMLRYPSLVELLPSGVYMANDDHRDRMVAIDPATSALVWQYGTNDQPGTAVGMLHKPDGFDMLLPNGATPTHGATK